MKASHLGLEIVVKRITVIDFRVHDGGGVGTGCCRIEVGTACGYSEDDKHDSKI